jgi:hypothetical protein
MRGGRLAPLVSAELSPILDYRRFERELAGDADHGRRRHTGNGRVRRQSASVGQRRPLRMRHP